MNIITTAVFVLISSPILYRVYQYIEWMYRTWFVIGKAVNKFPGDPIKWPHGNLHQMPPFDERETLRMKDLAARFKTACRMWIGPFLPMVILFHPETVKTVAKTEEPKVTETRSAYVLGRPWLGDGLLLIGGQKWKRNRRLLTPAFHFDILKRYISVYNEEAEILMNKWMKKSANGESFDVQTDVSLCTLGTILTCAFSYEENIQEAGEHHPYVEAVLDMSRLLIQRNFNPVLRANDFLYSLSSGGRKFFQHCDYVHQVADNVITERSITLREDPHALDNKRYLDFLDILLQAKDKDGTGLSHLEIRHEVDTFLFEGHDTTAAGISWSLYALAKYPEFQKKAQQEIDELLADRPDKCIMWDDLNKLPYLTQCIKEAMRMWPPVPAISRQNTQPLTIDGVTVPPHTLLQINIIGLHHNPSVWGDDHEEYKPDRFDPDEVAKMDNFAFLPFSAGPRNCIGQNFALNEMKIVIGRVLQRFCLSVDENHPIAPRPEVITRAIHGIKLFMAPR